ncbi:MAG TPA: phage tail sheath C-terminal domain-containing protein [Lunatimonas sp.]|nr:phage tail sheath C-terminal domain-containing protein [Lunatimonas sp.]
MDYQVPGVFIEETPLFPPSVAAVATGLPAFIGFTERIVDPNGNPLVNRPVRLTSLLEYKELFGGEYIPASYTVGVDPSNFSILNIHTDEGFRFYLFDALRLYFDNGGGPCYIVSVGDYESEITYGDLTTGLRGGLRSLEKIAEPTILVAPDLVGLRNNLGGPDYALAGTFHQDMIAQCAKLQDRVVILDLLQGFQELPGPVDEFRDALGTQNLNYAAAYYPWLLTSYSKPIHFTQLNFVDNQTVPDPIPDATLDTMTGVAVTDGLLTSLRAWIAEEDRIYDKIAEVSVDRLNYTQLHVQLTTLRNAVFAGNTAGITRPAFIAMMNFVRQMALAFQDLVEDGGNSTELTQSLLRLEGNSGLQTALINLIAFEKNPDVMNSIANARTVADVEADYSILDSADWIGGEALVDINPNGIDYSNGGTLSISLTAHAAARSTEFQSVFDTISEAFISLVRNQVLLSQLSEKQLFVQHPFFKAVHERVTKFMCTIPPSGAMAGIYAFTDRTRGVWKAPANVGLRNVLAPTIKLTDQEQGSLNIHSSGKSINAIRAFTGKGILVWGARTLAGNDNEWRYINVRRFFTYVEMSTKKATEPFVFESNDANTWVRIRAMIENFLTLQWRQGALAGSTAKEAFFVKVGLNETMTAQDILEGRLIVEIGMAAVRPAEFIILRFSHKMQES